MAKAVPAFAETRQRRSTPDVASREGLPASGADSVIFLLVKNALFWGSAGLSCAVIYLLISTLV